VISLDDGYSPPKTVEQTRSSWRTKSVAIFSSHRDLGSAETSVARIDEEFNHAIRRVTSGAFSPETGRLGVQIRILVRRTGSPGVPWTLKGPGPPRHVFVLKRFGRSRELRPEPSSE